MNPSPQPKPAKQTVGLTRTVVAVTGVSLLALAFFVNAAGNDAVIGVVFDADDMGFNATSTKDISNVIVEDCDGETHKHDGLTGHSFVHRETYVIAAVYVKSGNNGIAGNDPPGAGERFENAGACDETSSTTTTTSEPPSETSTTSEPPSETSTTSDPPSEEVPFFTSTPTLIVGVAGALAGSLLMLRRKL